VIDQRGLASSSRSHDPSFIDVAEGERNMSARHPNQYLITFNKRPLQQLNRSTVSFCGLDVHHHASLAVTTAHHGVVSILLIGYIIDPERPAFSDRDIIASLAHECATKEQLFRCLQHLSGRFALVYNSSDDRIVVGDPCGCRRIYYSFTEGVVTSSLDLFWDAFGMPRRVASPKQALVDLPAYEVAERAWIGTESFDDRLHLVLPNHYLDLKKESVQRIPVDCSQLIDENDVCEYAAVTLKGSMAAIRNRFHVLQTLTAGFDTRTLLAASRDFAADTEFFVFASPDEDEKWPDVSIPLRLSRRLGLFLRVVRPSAVREDFVRLCDAAGVMPQPSRLHTAQYLHDHYSRQNVVRLAGLPSDIMKSTFYGYTRGSTTTEMLYAFSPYYRKSPFVEKQIAEWIAPASAFCREHSLQVLDLFYWEQRLGNWGALYAFEQDIAIEEFWPHGHRNMLLSVLKLDVSKRSKPDCRFHRDLVNHLWREAMLEPINPIPFSQRLNWRLRNHATLRYWKYRMLH